MEFPQQGTVKHQSRELKLGTNINFMFEKQYLNCIQGSILQKLSDIYSSFSRQCKKSQCLQPVMMLKCCNEATPPSELNFNTFISVFWVLLLWQSVFKDLKSTWHEEAAVYQSQHLLFFLQEIKETPVSRDQISPLVSKPIHITCTCIASICKWHRLSQACASIHQSFIRLHWIAPCAVSFKIKEHLTPPSLLCLPTVSTRSTASPLPPPPLLKS